jgi:hypothetical protein
LLLLLLLLLLHVSIALPCSLPPSCLLGALSPDLTEALRDDLMVGRGRDVAGWRARVEMEDQSIALRRLRRGTREERVEKMRREHAHVIYTSSKKS